MTKKEYLKIIYQSRKDFVLKIKKGRVKSLALHLESANCKI